MKGVKERIWELKRLSITGTCEAKTWQLGMEESKVHDQEALNSIVRKRVSSLYTKHDVRTAWYNKQDTQLMSSMAFWESMSHKIK